MAKWATPSLFYCPCLVVGLSPLTYSPSGGMCDQYVDWPRFYKNQPFTVWASKTDSLKAQRSLEQSCTTLESPALNTSKVTKRKQFNCSLILRTKERFWIKRSHKLTNQNQSVGMFNKQEITIKAKKPNLKPALNAYFLLETVECTGFCLSQSNSSFLA